MERMGLHITVGQAIYLDGEIPFTLRDFLEQELSFPNPEYLEKEKYGFYLGDTPAMLSFIQQSNGSITIPRGFLFELLNALNQHNVVYTLSDETRSLPEVPFEFTGQLHDFQQDAVEAALKHQFGVFNAPTGSGKTVMALYLIANRKQPALVICHTKELMYQWRDRAMQFLGLPENEIGLIGDGKKDLGHPLTIGIVNSVVKLSHSLKDRVGHLIVDECHRTPARTFAEAVTAFDSKYMLGLSATPYRRDGLTKLIYLHLGDERYRIDSQTLQDQGRIIRATLMVTKTGFDYNYRDDYQWMIQALIEDEDRNRLIAEQVLKTSRNNGIILVISDRKAHCRSLFSRIKPHRSVALLLGNTPGRIREEIIGKLNQGQFEVLIATSQLIGEGFDCPPLSHIFLATPVKFSGRVIQYIGRILRKADGKTGAVVHDFVDRPGVLQASFYTRKKTYRELGVI